MVDFVDFVDFIDFVDFVDFVVDFVVDFAAAPESAEVVLVDDGEHGDDAYVYDVHLFCSVSPHTDEAHQQLLS